MRLSTLRSLAGVTISLLCMKAALATVATPVMNDGYLIVEDLAPYAWEGKNPGLVPRLCPPGASAGTLADGGPMRCLNNGKEVRAVTPQQALDLAYGANVAVAIGVAPIVAPRESIFNGPSPADRLQTVIYFRRAAVER